MAEAPTSASRLYGVELIGERADRCVWTCVSKSWLIRGNLGRGEGRDGKGIVISSCQQRNNKFLPLRRLYVRPVFL